MIASLPTPSAIDTTLMRWAIALGERGRLSAPPNPWVGCVIATGGIIVGEGYHHRAGEPHAEIEALADAGARASGATCYVTLEPCCHYGRTPPCVNALIAAGIARVVVAVEDPDSRVSGQGVAALRAAAVTVDVGVGAAEATASLLPYLHQRRHGRPYCVVKAAMSVDGRTAAADGTSQWITGEAARRDAHTLRAASQAIVIGSGTALADRPSLTVRGVDAPPTPPVRVLLDGRGRVPATGPLFDTTLAPTLVVTSHHCSASRRREWEDAGCAVNIVSNAPDGAGVDITEVLALLGSRGIVQALVEGGSTLQSALVAGGFADSLVVYVGSKVLGDGGAPLFPALPIASLPDAITLNLIAVKQLDDTARLDFGR